MNEARSRGKSTRAQAADHTDAHVLSVSHKDHWTKVDYEEYTIIKEKSKGARAI